MNRPFEWDPGKAASNARKHNVEFEEAVTVFADRHATIDEDHEHSEGEDRFRAVGWSVMQRLLVVTFTIRGSAFRIISARPATRSARRKHAG